MAPIFEVKTSLLFPMAIRFTVLLSMTPDQVKSARVHLSQTLVYDHTFDMPITKDTIRLIYARDTAFQYALVLDPATAPVPFVPLDYELSFTSVVNVTSTYKGQTDYYDTTQKWKNTVGDTLNLYTHNSSLALDLIQQGVLRAYSLISADTSIKHSFKMVIYEAGTTPCMKDPKRQNQTVVIDPVDHAEFPCDPALAVPLYKAHGFIEVLRTSPLINMLQDQISEIIATDAYAAIWANAAEAPPAWFQAGMAARYDVVGHSYALLQARDADRTDQLLSLDELAVPAIAKPGDLGASVRAWNGQSFLLTLYLAARYGVAAPVIIAQRIAQNGKFVGALDAVGNGAKIEDLYTSWKNWLLSSDADEAVAWTPYLTGATPTHTPSPTDFPTITPTDNGPTATDTPLFSRTNTPRPSITPIPSNTPNLPTNTPLPPGSLNTATPISTGSFSTKTN